MANITNVVIACFDEEIRKITRKGFSSVFGENQINPKNPKETQPMYYENKFLELLKELGIK